MNSEETPRRPKRKAAAAALDIIFLQKLYEEDDDDEDDKKDLSPEEEEEEASMPLCFCGDSSSIELPKEIFVEKILGFLPKPVLVHYASLVCKAWCEATRDPLLWETALSADIWKVSQCRKFFSSMRKLFLFLSRPQFARLKRLATPLVAYRTIQRNVFDKIASICPLLEELDLSGVGFTAAMPVLCVVAPFEDELPRLPNLFPNLKRFGVCMRYATRKQLQEFARSMGERLEQLRIVVPWRKSSNDLIDDTFETIAEHCPNLSTFHYDLEEYQSPTHGFLSARGPIAIIKHCSLLRDFVVTVPRTACPDIFEFCRKHGYFSRTNIELLYPTADDDGELLEGEEFSDDEEEDGEGFDDE
jgi:hypothetical protein